MTSKAKLKKALQLIEDALEQGDIELSDELEQVSNELEDIIEREE